VEAGKGSFARFFQKLPPFSEGGKLLGLTVLKP